MNINEIAKMAGVSKSAVSRYINNGPISEEKREKIKRVIDETGYRPNIQAQHLKTKASGLLAVVFSDITDKRTAKIISGITSETAKTSYNTVFISSNTDNNLSDFDGIISVFEYISDTDIPVVIAGRKSNIFSCIYFDEALLIRDIIKKLSVFGNVGAVIPKNSNYKKILRDNIADESGIVFADGFNDGYNAVKKLKNISAVFCHNDETAKGAYLCIKENNLGIHLGTIFTDMSFDDIISGADIDFLIGTQAARELIACLEGENTVKEIKLSNSAKEGIKIGC